MIVAVGEPAIARHFREAVGRFDNRLVHHDQFGFFPELAGAAHIAPKADLIDKIAAADPVVAGGLGAQGGVAGFQDRAASRGGAGGQQREQGEEKQESAGHGGEGKGLAEKTPGGGRSFAAAEGKSRAVLTWAQSGTAGAAAAAATGRAGAGARSWAICWWMALAALAPWRIAPCMLG